MIIVGFGKMSPFVLHVGQCNTNDFLLLIFDFFIANIELHFGHLKWCNEPLRDFSKSLTAWFPRSCMFSLRYNKTMVSIKRMI